MKISVIFAAFLAGSSAAQKSASKSAKTSKSTKSSKSAMPVSSPTPVPVSSSPVSTAPISSTSPSKPSSVSPSSSPPKSPSTAPSAPPSPSTGTKSPSTSPTASPSFSPSTFLPDALTPQQGRCAWTDADCNSLRQLIDSRNNHQDVNLLQTEICQAFASMTPPHYPANLNCPLNGHAPVQGELKLINRDQTEMNAGNNWSTCGGDVFIEKIIRGGNIFYQYKMRGHLSTTHPATRYEMHTKCPQYCREDPLCKYAMWDISLIDTAQSQNEFGKCLIFHAAEAQTQDNWYSRICSIEREGGGALWCTKLWDNRPLYAKCDNFNVPSGNSTIAPTPSPTSSSISSAPIINPLVPVPGRCTWTEPDCNDLGAAINGLNQHPDVEHLHSGVCDAFAAMGHYPLSLHCHSNGTQKVEGIVKNVRPTWRGELTAATNYSTCGGGLKVGTGDYPGFFYWKLHAVLASTTPMDRTAANADDCGVACANEDLCKYAMWVPGNSLLTGNCLIFHESDTLTTDSYWTKVCGITNEKDCVDAQENLVYAKCTNFNNPSSNTLEPTSAPPTSAPIAGTLSPTSDIFTPRKGRCAWTQADCYALQNVVAHGSQPSDSTLLHTELCATFASLGQYPASLHCPSAGAQIVQGVIRRIDNDPLELSAATNYTTCSGGIKIGTWKLNPALKAWQIHGVLAKQIQMDLNDNLDCLAACANDPYCKYSAWFLRNGNSLVVGTGDCLVFHPSDTLTHDTYWERGCGFDGNTCMSGTQAVFAKCTDFNIP